MTNPHIAAAVEAIIYERDGWRAVARGMRILDMDERVSASEQALASLRSLPESGRPKFDQCNNMADYMLKLEAHCDTQALELEAARAYRAETEAQLAQSSEQVKVMREALLAYDNHDLRNNEFDKNGNPESITLIYHQEASMRLNNALSQEAIYPKGPKSC